MNKVINTEKIPIKLWLDDIEEGALEQAKNLTNLPFAFKHIAIMPDSHLGYGMPIGGVLATKDVIIPNAVGVDIGCGMCAVKTSLTEIDTDTLKKILGEIRKEIPVGFNKHKEEQGRELMPLYSDEEKTLVLPGSLYIVRQEYKNALKSLGTLGGGNHFIEIQKGDDGHIWIMIHSGSRNLGKQIADHYDKIARELNKKWYSEVPDKWELAFLPVNSKEGQSYIREMNYAVEFALANRKLMIDRVIEIFQKELVGFENPETKFNEMINIAHNYARQENHFGKNVWVHRKGATSAREEEIGIIPGSQGTKSYIVKGKGNPESFESCSHGAGRKMGRKQAQRSLSYEEEIKKMGSVIHGMRGEKDLDEAPGSYKDIDVVMQNQKDLVDIVVELSPLAVIKG
jgi:tRNA-splicing ligase RtcB